MWANQTSSASAATNRLPRAARSAVTLPLVDPEHGAITGCSTSCHETVLATYYNASNAELLRTHSEDFAEKVRQQSIDPRIPWLYVFHLEFRFT